MTHQPGHPVPPPELMNEWRSQRSSFNEDMTIAAVWSADQELAACAEFILSKVRRKDGVQGLVKKLYATRRPNGRKVSKVEALRAMEEIKSHLNFGSFCDKRLDLLEHFLNTLPD
jgi:hypothetical protein